jgi:monomeric sarcosine oxidase
MPESYDFAVIGAGVFGVWTAHYLRQSGARVILIDAYGPANSRASSSGETRVIRMGYGADELYTDWAARSLVVWREFFERVRRPLFVRTGVLFVSNDSDSYLQDLLRVIAKNEVPHERLSAEELRIRYPQLHFGNDCWAVYEPESGALLARQAVQAVVEDAVRNGVSYLQSWIERLASVRQLAQIKSSSGDTISAGTFIFACGPWLPKLFPNLLADRIFPTRQEVFFVGAPAGSDLFRPPKMPIWLHHPGPDIPYAIPDIENRGFKIAFDRHGAAFDPDTGSRTVDASSIERLRAYLRTHVPVLADAPIVETRVCQYENTWNGDFLIDRHPEYENVWIAGGGSGHGFKHGPMVGEYVSNRILHNAPAEPRFAMGTKETRRARSVY